MVTCLLMHQRELAQRIAQHEMGHYVVATLCGFSCGSVSLQLLRGEAGHRGAAETSLGFPAGSLEAAETYLERRCLVLLAGALAETLQWRSPEPLVQVEKASLLMQGPDTGCTQDHAKYRELVHLLCNIRHPETSAGADEVRQAQLDALSSALWQRAIDLVQTHAELICGLAGNLAGRMQQLGEAVMISKAEMEDIPAVKQLLAALPPCAPVLEPSAHRQSL